MSKKNEFDPNYDEEDDDDFDEDDYDEFEKASEAGFDLEDIIHAWQDDCQDNLYYFDTDSGAIKLCNRHLFDLRELTDELEKNKERYLYLPKAEPKQLKEDLRDFQKTIEDANLKRVLDMAFESPHVYSSFKSILKDKGNLMDTLEHFRRSRTCVRIRQWMQANSMEDRWPVPVLEEKE